ncbi:unnamed protein product [Larinioides sclopetarius]|uniref:Uncharacterized protein n=1 Tax=Larinioides sclopetarius TaxID=280406 RepID=A0AAV2B4N8_9ARAC
MLKKLTVCQCLVIFERTVTYAPLSSDDPKRKELSSEFSRLRPLNTSGDDLFWVFFFNLFFKPHFAILLSMFGISFYSNYFGTINLFVSEAALNRKTLLLLCSFSSKS